MPWEEIRNTLFKALNFTMVDHLDHLYINVKIVGVDLNRVLVNELDASYNIWMLSSTANGVDLTSLYIQMSDVLLLLQRSTSLGL